MGRRPFITNKHSFIRSVYGAVDGTVPVFSRGDLFYSMVVEFVTVVYGFSCPCDGQNLAFAWVKLHLPLGVPYGKLI